MSPRLKKDNTAKPAGDMPVLAHLGELRRRVLISAAAVLATSVIGFFMWNWVLDVAKAPYCEALAEHKPGQACELYITDPMQLLTTRLSVAVYIGLLLALPVVLWQIWRFVTPGLHKNEKRYAIPFVSASVGLFALGAFTAWLTFPRAISFFLDIGGSEIQTIFNPTPYLKLIFLMMLIFGLVFEIPLLLVFLQLAGIVSSRRLRDFRRYAIVCNFIIAAVATPSQDPYSMLAMAIPMCLFYEIAIVIGRIMKK